MKAKIVVLLVALAHLLAAQPPKDSLLQKIKTYKKEDTVRVELLVDACVGGVFSVDTQLLSFANEALIISQKINYKLGKIRANNCIGNYYYQRTLYDKAFPYYTQALKLAEKDKDDRNIIISKSNIANVFIRTQREKDAVAIFRQCDQLLMNRGDSLSQNRAAILTNMASAYSKLDMHDSAVYMYKKVFAICEAKNIGFGLAMTYSNLASEYWYLKQFPLAIENGEKGVKLQEEMHLDFLRPSLLKVLGSTYLEVGQTDKGIQYLEKAVITCKQLNDKENLTEVYRRLFAAYYKVGKYKEAYLTSIEHMALKDTLYNAERNKIVTDINTKYETEKKEASIKQLKQENEITELQSQRKTILIYAILGAVIIVLVLVYFLFSRYKVRKQNELLRLQLEEASKLLDMEKKAAESELKALKSQMNPHFIFNALNSIQEQFMYGDKLKANEQLENFTYLTRQILTVSGKKLITLGTEVEILTKYLELEKMRFKSLFQYSVELSDTIDEDYLQIPPMLIQPFVENSIKHGLLHKEGEKKLSVKFDFVEEGEYILCVVEDNGIGREKSAEIKSRNETKHASFSTTAIEQRLALLNENLRLNELIVFEDLKDESGQPMGTRVVIKIPL